MAHTKYNKLAQFIKNPLDPATAKIIGGIGGLLLGLGIAGSIVAYENLSVPSIAIIFIVFGLAGSLAGIRVIDYAAQNSASLSTIMFAMMGTDFAGPLGAIAATAFISATNVVLHKITGMTIDDMFADGIVASVNGVDQIAKDSREAIANIPTKTKGAERGQAHIKAATAEPQISAPSQQQNVQQNVPKQKTTIVETKKPRKTFTKKLEEARSAKQDPHLNR